MLLIGTAPEGKLLLMLLLLLPIAEPEALPEAIAGAISFRPRLSKLLETLLMFSGATLALALKNKTEMKAWMIINNLYSNVNMYDAL